VFDSVLCLFVCLCIISIYLSVFVILSFGTVLVAYPQSLTLTLTLTILLSLTLTLILTPILTLILNLKMFSKELVLG
jgi:hypothetical protein